MTLHKKRYVGSRCRLVDSVNVCFFIDRQYDPERAEASEIAAKRKRLSQIKQRMEKTDSNASEG